MADLSIREARAQFAELLNRVHYTQERVILHRRGRPIAAIVPIEDLERLQALEDQADLEEAQAAVREAEQQGWIPLRQLLAERQRTR